MGDTNPFGPPSDDENPFASAEPGFSEPLSVKEDDLDDNPFVYKREGTKTGRGASPAGGVAAATTTTPATATTNGGGGGGGGKDANPFDESDDEGAGAGGVGTGAKGKGSVFAAASSTATSLASRAEMRVKAEELRRMEERLDAKERELDEREAALPNPPNFPYCCPLVYHDIEDEIPDENKTLCKQGYFGWWLFAVTLGINAIAILGVLFGDTNNTNDNIGWDVAIACVAVLVGPPWAFFTWYRSLYFGLKNKKSSVFWSFFISMTIHVLCMVTWMIGIAGTGGAGIITITKTYNDSVGAGVICIISTIFFAGNAVFSGYILYATYQVYSNAGLSLEQAKREAATDFAQSDAGRNMAKQSAKNAVKV